MIVFVAFLLALGPLVFIHELGHFLAAKSFGVGVPVFSLGFGPRLLGFRRRETDYRVSLVPLGGYVRMAGDEADEHRTGAPEEFLSRPRWQRFVVYVAGASFNVVFAVLAVWVLFWAYGRTEDPPAAYPIVDEVEASSPAERAGARPQDRIVRIGAQDVREAEDFTEAYRKLLRAPDDDAPLVVERAGTQVELRLHPGGDAARRRGDLGWKLSWPGRGVPIVGLVDDDSPAAQALLEVGDTVVAAGTTRPIYEPELRALLEASLDEEVALTIEHEGTSRTVTLVPRDRDAKGTGKIGVAFRPSNHRDLDAAGAMVESVRMNARLSTAVLEMLKKIFITREESVKNLSGPLGIAKVAKQALVAGPDAFLSFLAFVSLQLGIFNLLPIPVLDGGHILVLGAEAVMRRDFSERVKERLMQAGLVVLLLFFAVVMYNDAGKINALTNLFRSVKNLF